LEFNVPFQHKYGYIRDEHIKLQSLQLTLGNEAKEEFLVRFSCSRSDSNRCDAGL